MTAAPLVCIVDDTADYRFLLEELFSHYLPTYSVRFFTDGRDFLNQLPFLSSLPNLVLLDQHMPILDGHETLLFLKEQSRYKKIPVVMMSADASAEEINDCFETGVNSFLRKPTDFTLLKEQLGLTCRYWLEFNLKQVEGV
ncbi:PleD family two-component system response regulator [Spirosoma soli]|uniref:PleD family two-component system response regulator n=1 Tax=Spirosoma soli TaxID=1770529 RepID=A0ABW5LY31_9BACT